MVVQASDQFVIEFAKPMQIDLVANSLVRASFVGFGEPHGLEYG